MKKVLFAFMSLFFIFLVGCSTGSVVTKYDKFENVTRIATASRLSGTGMGRSAQLISAVYCSGNTTTCQPQNVVLSFDAYHSGPFEFLNYRKRWCYVPFGITKHRTINLQ
jgi:hypothetical protein